MEDRCCLNNEEIPIEEKQCLLQNIKIEVMELPVINQENSAKNTESQLKEKECDCLSENSISEDRNNKNEETEPRSSCVFEECCLNEDEIPIEEKHYLQNIKIDVSELPVIHQENCDKNECCEKDEKCDCSAENSKDGNSKNEEMQPSTSGVFVCPFKCDHCESQFSFKSDLRRHSTRHIENGVFPCSFCSKTFPELNKLRLHLRNHTDLLSYKCITCEKCFNSSRNLKRHQNIHEAKRKFSCDYCEKSFCERSILEKHKLTHSNDPQYSCNLCSKSFTLPKYLQAHRKIHSDDHFVKCDFCDKTFSKRQSLKNHVAKVHDHGMILPT